MEIDFSKQTGKMILTKGNHKIALLIENIIYIQCNGELATIFLNDKSKAVEIKTIKSYEKELGEMGFIRISRNTIVNGKYITELDTNNAKRNLFLGEIVLKISKRRINFIKKHFY
jgi:DNA-binding LytR/AlgR family response regulator